MQSPPKYANLIRQPPMEWPVFLINCMIINLKHSNMIKKNRPFLLTLDLTIETSNQNITLIQ